MKNLVLKSLVSYTQNLQNVQFYSYKIKFTVFLKHFRDIMAWASKKPIIKNTIIIYNISVRPKFQLNISKIMPARPKNTGTLVVNATILTPGLAVAITI